jgi:hypothetical protein
MNEIRTVFSELPDSRKVSTSNNLKYDVTDAVLSAFSVFFTQSPSFLDYQVRMQKECGKNNAQSIFGVHKLSSDNQIRNLLDPILPETLFPVLAEVGDVLYQEGYLKPFRAIGDTLLVALDGTDFFASEKISCPCCTQQTLKNGKTLNRHTAVTPVIVAPGQSNVVPLPPAFVQPQDGHEKQDCELAAAKRWLETWGSHYSAWRVTLLGDDLYCHQPYCQAAIDQNFDLLLVCKPESHSLMYEWIADFERTGQVQTLEKTCPELVERARRDGKQRFTDSYRYINQVPLRNSDDALMLNWCELTITNAAGKVVFRNAWATTHVITDDNLEQIAAAGRCRWKIENENNNILKNHGYHFEHNFGHGKLHLSNFLATLNLLAFLLHTTLDWIDVYYHTVRNLLPSRRTFFEHLRALMQYFPFDNWEQLMNFMLERLDGKIPNSS